MKNTVIPTVKKQWEMLREFFSMIQVLVSDALKTT